MQTEESGLVGLNVNDDRVVIRKAVAVVCEACDGMGVHARVSGGVIFGFACVKNTAAERK